MVCAGCAFFFGLELDDGLVKTFWLLLYVL